MSLLDSHHFSRLAHDIAALDSEIIILATLIVCAFTVLNFIAGIARRRRKESGIDAHSETVSIDGGSSLKVRHYVSEMQGLAGKPDALISENGFIIPIERKPLANKIRDRYVAQLLVYMRLVEEFEGKRPPYGYLILGANCRKIKIENSEEKQAWLQSVINDMRSVLDGNPAVATPHTRKCRKCDVREHCSMSAAEAPIPVHSRSKLLAKTAS